MNLNNSVMVPGKQAKCDVHSSVCTRCFNLNIYRILHEIPVSDIPPARSALCSSTRLQPKAYWSRITSIEDNCIQSPCLECPQSASCSYIAPGKVGSSVLLWQHLSFRRCSVGAKQEVGQCNQNETPVI